MASRINEDHPILDAILRVRRRNAGDFSGKLTAPQSEAYDRAVMDCYHEVEAELKKQAGEASD